MSDSLRILIERTLESWACGGEEQILKRKKLHIPLLNRMRKKKGLALIASFIWECETKGFYMALKDVLRFFMKKR